MPDIASAASSEFKVVYVDFEKAWNSHTDALKSAEHIVKWDALAALVAGAVVQHATWTDGGSAAAI